MNLLHVLLSLEQPQEPQAANECGRAARRCERALAAPHCGDKLAPVGEDGEEVDEGEEGAPLT